MAEAAGRRLAKASGPPADRWDGPTQRRAALALWVTLALLAAARAALAFVPSMLAWSLNLQRFLAPGWAWAPWTLGALALVPAVARRAEPAFRRAGDAIARGSWRATLPAVACAALLVWTLPDQVRFVGDFQLRRGAINTAAERNRYSPQAMPLDTFLHVDLPARLLDQGPDDTNRVPRALGAVEAGLLAALALAFARALALRGTPALAAAATVFFGGYLGLYTGYSKVNGELALLTAVVAAAGLRCAREGRGLPALGIALALGAFLHRSVLGFVPAVALAFALALRREPGGWRRPAMWIAFALPVLAFAFTLGRILHTLTHFDPGMHLASPEVRAEGGLLSAAFAGSRAVDLPNVVVLLAPLAPALAVVALAAGRRLPLRREAALLATLAAPFLGLLVLLHPAQGVFRDYDTLAEAGVAIALLAAWLLGEVLRRIPAHAWLGVTVALAAAVPSVQWIAHQTDVDRGLARVTALLTEPPARGPSERGITWDYVGIRNFNRQHWAEAAEGFARAAQTQPSARLLTEWAMAENMRGNLPRARRLYGRALERDSLITSAWHGYAIVCVRMGDLDEAHRAVQRLLQIDPANSDGQVGLGMIERLQAARAQKADLRPAPATGPR